MSINDFFKDMDNKLEIMHVDEALRQERASAHEEEVKRFVEESVPHLEEYKQQLERRGVKVDFSHSETSLKFLMYYAVDGHSGFKLTKDYKYDHYIIQGTHTNDNGGHYISEGGDFKTNQKWLWAGFEDYVQQAINTFFSYADRHGGYTQKSQAANI